MKKMNVLKYMTDLVLCAFFPRSGLQRCCVGFQACSIAALTVVYLFKANIMNMRR